MSFSDIAGRLRQHTDSAGQTGSSPRNFDELYLLRARILGVLIRDAREAAELSQAECASRVGVAPEQLEQWELGQAMPSLPQLELLAFALNLPISHFWGTQTLQRRAEQKHIDAAEYTTLRGKLLGGLLRAARERLNRLMGLWGVQTAFRLPERLPDLPAQTRELPDIERIAIEQRLDVQGAKLAAEQTARNLAISLSLEASEVLEHFQWSAETSDPEGLRGELADVALYLLQLASVSGIDLEQAILDKIRANWNRSWSEESE